MDWDSLYEWAANKTDERLWPLSEDARSMMLHVIDLPSDRTRKLIIADYFDEQELDPLGNAFRWCAKKRKFPYSKQYNQEKVLWKECATIGNNLREIAVNVLFYLSLNRTEMRHNFYLQRLIVYRESKYKYAHHEKYNIPALETAVLIAMIDLGNALILAEKK